MVDMRTCGWRSDTCGCDIIYQWDEDLPVQDRVMTVHTVVHRCSSHSGLTDDADLYAHVQDQNRRKNYAFDEAAVRLGFLNIQELRASLGETEWWYTGSDDGRVLHVSIPGLNQGQKNQIQKAIDTRFGVGKVVVE